MYKSFIFVITFLKLVNIQHIGVATAAVADNNFVCDCNAEYSVLKSFQNELKAMNSLLQSELASIKATLNSIQAQQNTVYEQNQNQLAEFNGKDIPVCTQNVNVLHDAKNVRNSNEEYPSSCERPSGLYSIKVEDYSQEPFLVYCDHNIKSGDWTVIQRRKNGFVDFYRNWTEYKHGFGNLNGEFWIGLDKLHALTTQSPQELLIVLEDFDNKRVYANYDAFAIGNETEGYALNTLGDYSGDAGDSLREHKNMKFSTKDVDNDISNITDCAEKFTGAWWFHQCHTSNLNGQYLQGVLTEVNDGKGVEWRDYRIEYSLKFVQMMIRPK